MLEFDSPASVEAVAGITNHLNKFWAPPVRRKIVQYLDQGGEGLDPLVKEAVERLRATLPNEAEYSG